MTARRLAVLLALGLVAPALIGAPAGMTEVAGASTAQMSSGEVVAELVVRSSDLPARIDWSSQPTGPIVFKGSQKFIACMDRGGPKTTVSPDPFGLTGKVAGDVTASVQSPSFVQKGSSTGEPNVTSTVTLLKTPAQAAHDLGAADSRSFFPCLGRLDAAAGLEGSLARLVVPRLGDGMGVGIRFVGKFPHFPREYADAFFYVERNVEIELSFTNGFSPFPKKWEWAIAAKVMERAKVLMA